MGVEGVAAHRALEVEVQALAGGRLGHRGDRRPRLVQRHAVLLRDQLGVAAAPRGRRGAVVGSSSKLRHSTSTSSACSNRASAASKRRLPM